MSTINRDEIPNALTAEEYLEWESAQSTRNEYVGGEVYPMVGGTTDHNRIVLNTILALSQTLDSNKYEVFGIELKLHIPRADSFFYPDVMVLRKADVRQGMYQTQPVLIVEVLSPSTRSFDQSEKRNEYFSIHSLQHYLLVEQSKIHVRGYHRVNDNFEETIRNQEDDFIEVQDLDGEVSMSQIYRGIEFGRESA